MPREMRVLVGCECSGRVRDEFAKLGWEAWSADLLPSETNAEFNKHGIDGLLFRRASGGGAGHYRGDVRDLFSWDHPVNANRFIDGQCNYVPSDTPLWDLCIMHPPCDHLSLAGARWWPAKRADGRQDKAAEFFMEMVNAPSPLVAVENPIGDMTRRYRPPDQIVEPWWFGDPFAKKTCLWLKNLPHLVADQVVEPAGRITTGGGSWRTDKAAARTAMNAYEDSEGRANRAKVRSRTMQGFARAMAQEWDKFAREFYGA